MNTIGMVDIFGVVSRACIVYPPLKHPKAAKGILPNCLTGLGKTIERVCLPFPGRVPPERAFVWQKERTEIR